MLTYTLRLKTYDEYVDDSSNDDGHNNIVGDDHVVNTLTLTLTFVACSNKRLVRT